MENNGDQAVSDVFDSVPPAYHGTTVHASGGTYSFDPTVNVEQELKSVGESFQKVLQHINTERQRLQSYIDEEMNLLKAEKLRVNEELAQQREVLVREKDKLMLMRSVAENIHNDQDCKVRIDVGGQEFVSTLRTITTEKDSVFEALFSGNYAVERTSSGAIHIDRDPKLFIHVLNFLRALRACRETQRPDLTRFPDSVDEVTKEQLIIEAQYFGLDCMLRCLRCSTIHVSSKSKYRKISEALQDARDGDTIVVAPGKYVDSFTILHSVHIIGDGDRSEIIIQGPNIHCIECRSAGGSLRNLTVESAPVPGTQGNFAEYYCVLISEGSIVIEGNDLRNTGLSCVKIIGDQQAEGGATPDTGGPTKITNPTLRNNHVHNASQCGILLTNGAFGLLEGNEIYDNRFSGIEMRHGAAPIVKGNNVHDNRQNGVYIHSAGLGQLVGNNISKNQFNGINVEGAVLVAGNTVTANAKRGIYHAHDTVLQENDVTGNVLGDIALKG